MYFGQSQSKPQKPPAFFKNESPSRIRENDTTRSRLFHKSDEKFEYQTVFQGFNKNLTPAHHGLKCLPKKDHKPEHFYSTTQDDERQKLKSSQATKFEPKFKDLSPPKMRKQESLKGIETKQSIYGETKVTQSLSKLYYECPSIRTNDKKVPLYNGKQNFLNSKYLEPTDRMKNLSKRLSQKK